ncbi:hypothetical protein [Devosia sp. A369]
MFEPDVESEFDTFTDLLFNSCVAFAFFFFLAFALISPSNKTGKVDTEVELLITVGWPDNHPDDVDIYVQDPAGNIVWYHQREGGLMHLDRDDRGEYMDVISLNGEEIRNSLNQEIVSVRGLMDGEYIVNVVHYIATTTQPVPVTAKVEKVNPVLKVIYYGQVMLGGTGQEDTVVRFTLNGSTITDVNNRPTSLVALVKDRGNAPRQPPQLSTDGGGGSISPK